ncbi:elongation factor Ts [Verrucomicrobiaceae bacterium R5-34]|uniref:Elongation factor Ts n=2 Tax=Oceaniferula flava TaxID=2800421 RepID=A0AAE2SCM1_9BACT|nr:elongation factor Ts [Verrucomicrobiaceae bacterium R5-34]MBK1854050.1 elongation factor Ts [Oceaniferula flavus]MBM1135356.1 elongation factor Ts [Oceaniferula flavus]
MMITASAVQELRKITNAGMMACKKALTETEGDMDAAVKLLREKGIVKSAGRSDRETSEGLVSAHVSECGKSGLLAEVNCETDFVAKNEDFGAFVTDITKTIAESDAADAEAAAAVSYADGTVQDALGAKFTELGEVIKIKRVARYNLEGNGAIDSYIHMGGKVGVLLELGAEKEETASNEAFQQLSRDICLHIAALNPAGLSRDDIDASTIEEENEINRKQLEAEGKPAEIIEKILIGKINKYFSESCLIDQAFVKDDKVSVKQQLAAVGKEIGDTLTIRRFARFNIGA